MRMKVILVIIGLLSAKGFAQVTGSGTALILDASYSSNDLVYCDSVYLSMSGVSNPALGMRYYSWMLADDDTTYMLLGGLTVSSGTVSYGHASANNLVAGYKKMIVTEEVDGFGGTTPTLANTRFSAALYAGPGSPGSSNALTYVRQAIGSFTTPSGLGVGTWLVRQLIKPDNLVQHAGFAVSAGSIGEVKTHSDHVFDFVVGHLSGLVPGNSSVANNGDPLGYGLYRYGDFGTTYSAQGGAGYLIGLAVAQPDASPEIITEGNNSRTSLQNVFGANDSSGWVGELRDSCLRILTTNFGSLPAAQAAATIMRSIALKVRNGTVGPGDHDPATGGIFTAYWRAQAMATYSLSPVTSIIGGESDALPEGFALDQNFPNPFNAETIIRFRLPVDAVVRLRVCTLLGSEVAVLKNGAMHAGAHFATFGRTSLSSGVYFYELSVSPVASEDRRVFTETKRLVILK